MRKRLLKLPRRLFGYQAASVDQLIADRDSMLTLAEQRARSAEARIAELEEELSRREEDLKAVKSTGSGQVTPGSHPAIQEAPEPVHPAEVNRDAPVELDVPAELAGAEPETERTAPPGTSDLRFTSEPLPPEPALAVDEDAGDVERWLPRIWRRTVEFIPPPEPSADFDPMPIGNEDHDWTGPSAMPRYEQEAAVPVVSELPSSGVSEEPEPWVTGTESYGQRSWSAAERTEEPWSAIGYRDEHSAEAPVTLPQTTPAFMGEELANVLKTAEESASQIIRAWEGTRNQISQVDRLWREVRAEIIRFGAWRQHVDPMIETMQKFIEEARARIEEVPSRIQKALSPAVEAMARLDEGMAEFANASDVPELLGKLHADVAKALETDDFKGSTSETAPTVETESTHEGQPHQGDPNGAGSHQRVDMARVVHELRIMNESGDTIPAPDDT